MAGILKNINIGLCSRLVNINLVLSDFVLSFYFRLLCLGKATVCWLCDGQSDLFTRQVSVFLGLLQHSVLVISVQLFALISHRLPT